MIPFLFDSFETIVHLDIGCSGGFQEMFLSLPENKVILAGVDASTQEIKRLKSINQISKNQSYYNFFIGNEQVNNSSSLPNPNLYSSYPLHRTLAYLSTYPYLNKKFSSLESKVDYIINMFKILDRGAPVDASFSNLTNSEKNKNHFYAFHQDRMNVFEALKRNKARYIGLDTFIDEYLVHTEPDFVKIDVDGDELDIIESGKDHLKNALGVQIEVQIHGRGKEWAYIDLALKDLGFQLIDIELYRYDRFPLESKFLYDGIPAQTKFGPVMWGDATYIKINKNQRFFSNLGRDKSSKLVWFLMKLGFYGLAAEVLLENYEYYPKETLVTIYERLAEVNDQLYENG